MRMLSAQGAAFIGQFEGWSAVPYNDGAGYSTIGYGHLIAYRPPTRQDWIDYHAPISRDRGVQLLQQDARIAIAAVEKYITTPINQSQFDALVSFCFNVGAGGLAGTNVQQAVNSRNFAAVPGALGAWCHAGGGVMAGLVRRRAAEAYMFLHGNTPDAGGAAKPVDPLQKDERAWVTEWDHLRHHPSLAAHRRRQQLYDLMTARRKLIWVNATQHGGWGLNHRYQRYQILKQYTAGKRH